jgi:hypothetical protein
VARFLTTVPENLGFPQLQTVWNYPTGGSGPTAIGSTSYFGSDPLPPREGESLYTAIDLGDFSSVFKTVTLSNSHGGLTRRQSTFYKLQLRQPRSVQFAQNLSQFAYTEKTNRNTLLAFYKIEDGNRRIELPINNNGYVYKSTSINYEEITTPESDYPNIRLDPGEYLFLITNDIRFLETTYSITVAVALTDWRFVAEDVDDRLDFRFVNEGADEVIDFGSV